MGGGEVSGVGVRSADGAMEHGGIPPISPKQSFVINVLRHGNSAEVQEALFRSVKSGMFTEEELVGMLLALAMPEDRYVDRYYEGESEEKAQRACAKSVLVDGIAKKKFHLSAASERRLFDAFEMGELDNIPQAMDVIAGFKIPAEELAEALVLMFVLNPSVPMAKREHAMELLWRGLDSGRFKSVKFDRSYWPPHLADVFGEMLNEEVSMDRLLYEAFRHGMLDAIPSTAAVMYKLDIPDGELVEAVDHRMMSLLDDMGSCQRTFLQSKNPAEQKMWGDKYRVAEELFKKLRKVWDLRDPDHRITAGLMDGWIGDENEYVRAQAARIAPVFLGKKAYAWLKAALADEEVVSVRCEIVTAMAALMATGELSDGEAKEFETLALANIRSHPVLARDFFVVLQRPEVSKNLHKGIVINFLVRMMEDAGVELWARMAAAVALSSDPEMAKRPFEFCIDTILTTKDRYAYENCLRVVSRMGTLERGEFVKLLAAIENRAYRPSAYDEFEDGRLSAAKYPLSIEAMLQRPEPLSVKQVVQMLEPLYPEGRALLYSVLGAEPDSPIGTRPDELLAELNEMDDGELASLGDNAMDLLLVGSISSAEMPIVEKLARSSNAGVRKLAVQSLGRMNFDKMPEAKKSDVMEHGRAVIQRALADDDRPVRSAAVMALTKFGNDGDIPMLIDIVKGDPNAAMRGAAIASLTQLYGDRAPDPEFMAMLEAAVRDGFVMMEYLKNPDGGNSGFSCTPAFCGVGITFFAAMFLHRKGSEGQRELAAGLMRALFDNPQMRRIGGGVLAANPRDIKKFVLKELLASGRQEDRALIAEFLAKVDDDGNLAVDVLRDAYSLDERQAKSLLKDHPKIFMGISLDEVMSIAKSRPWIVKILGPKGLRDKKTAMIFVKINGFTLEHFPDFQGDEWIARAAIDQNGMAYRFVADPPKVRSGIDPSRTREGIARSAVERNYRAYDYVPADLKEKPAIRDRAIAKAKEVAMGMTGEGRALFDPFTDAMARDPEIVLPVIVDCPWAIKDVSMVLRNNPNFMGLATLANFNVIPYIDKPPQDVIWSVFADMMKQNGIDFGREVGSTYAEFASNMMLRDIVVSNYKNPKDLYRDYLAVKAAAESRDVEERASIGGE